MVRVLFVCMGNICRSPTAEGVFTKHVAVAKLFNKIDIDSAGTHAYHVGENPDPRAQKCAIARDIDLSKLRARKAVEEDFNTFDYVLAMDKDNYEYLLSICPSGSEHKLSLFMSYAPHLNVEEVPDPYYGGPRGFENVFDLIDQASIGLLNHIKQQHL